MQVLDLFSTDIYLEERHVDELLMLEELKGIGITIKCNSSILERLRLFQKEDFVCATSMMHQILLPSAYLCHSMEATARQTLMNLPFLISEAYRNW